MSKIICLNEKCPYRSKRPLRKRTIGGRKAYSCTRPVTVIGPVYDCDGDVYGLLGYTPMECRAYERLKYDEMSQGEDDEEDNSND